MVLGGTLGQGSNKTAGPGDPLQGRRINLTDMAGTVLQVCMTDANGQFEFRTLPTGSYLLHVSEADPATAVVVTIDEPGEVVAQNLALNSDGSMEAAAPTSRLSSFETSMHIQAWPNPFSSDLHLIVETPAAETLTVSMLDISGRTVLQPRPLGVAAGRQTIPLTPGLLPDGMYFLVVHSRQGRSVHRIIHTQ